jgi:hypothetical protein
MEGKSTIADFLHKKWNVYLSILLKRGYIDVLVSCLHFSNATIEGLRKSSSFASFVSSVLTDGRDYSHIFEYSDLAAVFFAQSASTPLESIDQVFTLIENLPNLEETGKLLYEDITPGKKLKISNDHYRSIDHPPSAEEWP